MFRFGSWFLGLQTPVVVVLVISILSVVLIIVILWFSKRKFKTHNLMKKVAEPEEVKHKDPSTGTVGKVVQAGLSASADKHGYTGPAQGKGKEPLYAEMGPQQTTSTGPVHDDTVVHYDVVTKTINPQGVMYELVQLDHSKSKAKPKDFHLVEYAELANLPTIPAKPAIPEEPPAVPPPRAAVDMSNEEMLSLLAHLSDKWKDLAERMGCSGDRLDEIFTNNETDLQCLCNLVDIYSCVWSKKKMAAVLQEMGETELARKFDPATKCAAAVPDQAQAVSLPDQAQAVSLPGQTQAV